MEYTKDIIIDIGCKREMGIRKLRNWTSKVKKVLARNKLITITFSLLVILVSIDIILVNSFLKLLSQLY